MPKNDDNLDNFIESEVSRQDGGSDNSAEDEKERDLCPACGKPLTEEDEE